MSHDRRTAEGGIFAISAHLPDSAENATDVTVALFELQHELSGITEPPVANVDTYALLDDEGEVNIEDYRSFYVDVEQHATPQHLEKIIRTIGEHAGEASIGTLHTFLPRAIGNVTLNLLTSRLIKTEQLKSQLQERVEVTLAVIQEAINENVKQPVARVDLADLGYDDSQSEGEIQFSASILPDASIDDVAQVAKIITDRIEQIKTQY